jgi:cell division protein FtsA
VSIEYRGKRYHFNEKIIRLVVEARMEELFEQIDRELKKIGKSRRLPGGVVIVGASANIPGLANFAKEKLQLPAKIGRMIELGGLIDTINSPEYATVVGLMMMDMLLSGQSTVTATFKVPNNLSAKMAKKLKRIIKL